MIIKGIKVWLDDITEDDIKQRLCNLFFNPEIVDAIGSGKLIINGDYIEVEFNEEITIKDY